MVDLHEGRVLSPHADDCPYIGSYVKCTKDLADGLEFVKGPQFPAEIFAMITRVGNGLDVLFPESLIKALDQAQHRLLNLTKVSVVGGFIDDLLSFVDDNTI